MQSAAATVEAYLAELPPERGEPIEAVRDVVRANLHDGFEEQMLYGMISWVVPLERYPETYNGQPLALDVVGATIARTSVEDFIAAYERARS